PLACLLLSGLWYHSLTRLSKFKLGIDPDCLPVLVLQLSPARYRDSSAIRTFYQRLEERLRALPGVQGISRTTGIAPRAHYTLGSYLEREGEGRPRDLTPQFLPFTGVDTGYFHVVWTQML